MDLPILSVFEVGLGIIPFYGKLILMETLLEIDRQLFLLINHLPHHPFLMSLMLFFSKIGEVAAVWFVLGLLLAFLKKKKDLKSTASFLYPLLLSLALSHILANLTLKPLTARLRPNFALPQTFLLGPAESDFSFPSGHATSSFAAACVLAKKKRGWRWGFYLLAVLISLSRIYLGVHYPLDVLGGVVLGVLIGKLSLILTSDRLKFLKI